MNGLLVAIAAAAVTGPAVQDDQPVAQPLPLVTESLEVSFLPGVWLPRLVGSVALGGGEIQVNHEFELNKNSATLNLELAVRKNETWEIWFGGYDFSVDTSGAFLGNGQTFGSLMLNSGTPYTSRLAMTSVATDISIAVWRPYADGHSRHSADNRAWNGRYSTDLRFCPQFGMRYIDVDQQVTTAAGTATGGGEWLAVYAGLLLELDYRPPERVPWLAMFRMQASFAAGPALGGDGGLMWQVRAGFTVQFTETWGVMIGYRLVEINADNGPYTFNGGLQGLFLAGSLQF